MIYKTHVYIGFCKEQKEDKYFYLIKGIEYPYLITDGNTLEDALDNAVDAWTKLCVEYENKKIQIKESIENLKLMEIPIIPKQYKIINGHSAIIEILSKDTDKYKKKIDDGDVYIISKISSINNKRNIDWIKNNNEFIGCITLDDERHFMLLLSRSIESIKYEDICYNNILTHELIIYNMHDNNMYKIKEEIISNENESLKELYDKINDDHMYRNSENNPFSIIKSLDTYFNLKNEVKKEAVNQLEEILKREKEERDVVLKHLLEFIGCLTCYSQRGDVFSTDGDPNYVFATHNNNGNYLSISRRTLCYMIDFLLDILDDYVITDINSKYVYFMNNDEIYVVEQIQDIYDLRRVESIIDEQEQNEIKSIVILKPLYDKYMKNKFKED